MYFVINASAALNDIDSGKESKSLSRFLEILDAKSKSENSNSFIVCLHDRFPEATVETRSRLSKFLDASCIKTCVLPQGIDKEDQDEWFDDYLHSFRSKLVRIDSSSLEQELADNQTSYADLERRKRLAFVSPIPPQKTGIANYSAELLDALSSLYNIDIITEDEIASKTPKFNRLMVKSSSWFLKNHTEYDLVLYQVGNSKFHQYQLPLIRRVPGTLVLHDFFLGDLQYYRFGQHDTLPLFERNTYNCDGYNGVLKYRHETPADVITELGLNYEFVRYASNIIVHSEYSKNLLVSKYDNLHPESITVIPHLRNANLSFSKKAARKRLGISDDVFFVCSFGVVTENKMHTDIVDAWSESSLASDHNARMTFVGQYDNPYGEELHSKIQKLPNKHQFQITGWTDDETFELYLAASDLAIQLRKNSRGETSGTVLDCMKYSVPLIINANGTMSELPTNAAYVLDDQFDQSELVQAINHLSGDAEKRHQIAQAGRENIEANHSPDHCAQQYSRVLEVCEGAHSFSPIESTLSRLQSAPSEKDAIINAAAQTYGGNTLQRTLFVDVTATSKTDLRTGIERTTRSLVKEMILSGKVNLRIEPVYLDVVNGRWTYRYARAFTYEVLGIEAPCLDDAPFEPVSGDLLIGLDHSGVNVVQASEDGLYDRLKCQGVSLSFLVHDILPVTNPEVFPPDANVHFKDWLNSLCGFSSKLIGVTDHVAREVGKFMSSNGYEQGDFPVFGYSHHGADFSPEIASTESVDLPLPEQGDRFLMVGTFEPRKRYDLALDIFEELWEKGDNSILIVVGKEGWTGLPDRQRRNIPELAKRFRNHPEKGRRLFWFDNADDATLNKLYEASDALLAMSEDEGFGLPLIEAAQKGLPIIARDIPVFREVAGDSAYFVDGYYPIGGKDLYVVKKMAALIAAWSLEYQENKHPKPANMTWKSWRDSAEHLVDLLTAEET